jgi:hypothetical protein
MTGNHRSTFQALTCLISAGTIVLLGACREPQAKQVANAPSQSSTVLTPPPVGILAVPGTPILQNDQLPTIPIRGLTPATEPKNLAAKTQLRAPDPFSNTNGPVFFPLPTSANPPQTHKVTKSDTGKSKPNQVAVKPIADRRTPTLVRPATDRRTAAIPSFPQTRFSQQSQPMQPISVPQIAIAPPPAPTVAAFPANAPPQAQPIAAPMRLADAISISGVLQTNGKTMVIAKSPNEQSARYVQAGDTIGQVRVKSIQVSRSGEPTVVLEQNGIEVTKSIGAGR